MHFSVFVGLAGLSIDKRNRCINTGLHIPIPILAFEIRLCRSILFHHKKNTLYRRSKNQLEMRWQPSWQGRGAASPAIGTPWDSTGSPPVLTEHCQIDGHWLYTRCQWCHHSAQASSRPDSQRKEGYSSRGNSCSLMPATSQIQFSTYILSILLKGEAYEAAL